MPVFWEGSSWAGGYHLVYLSQDHRIRMRVPHPRTVCTVSPQIADLPQPSSLVPKQTLPTHDFLSCLSLLILAVLGRKDSRIAVLAEHREAQGKLKAGPRGRCCLGWGWGWGVGEEGVRRSQLTVCRPPTSKR